MHFISKENYMSITAHLEELKRKHRTLSEQVDMAQRAPGADQVEVATLKKQKLKLKEEIARLSG
jgi:hypothetical protein